MPPRWRPPSRIGRHAVLSNTKPDGAEQRFQACAGTLCYDFQVTESQVKHDVPYRNNGAGLNFGLASIIVLETAGVGNNYHSMNPVKTPGYL